jgi:hypothetical protein
MERQFQQQIALLEGSFHKLVCYGFSNFNNNNNNNNNNDIFPTQFVKLSVMCCFCTAALFITVNAVTHQQYILYKVTISESGGNSDTIL